MTVVCDKLDTPDDCRHIRKSIENREPATVEWEVEFNPPADRVEVVVDEENCIDRIEAHYDKMGMLHITKVYTEDKTVNDVTHKKGEKHETLAFGEQHYHISQDTLPDGTVKAGSAHITDHKTGKVVWRESDHHK